MLKTQRLIILIGNPNLIRTVEPIVRGFHACQTIKRISSDSLANAFYYNKNAVYFSHYYEMMTYSSFNPLLIKLKEGNSQPENSVLGTNNVLKDFPKILALNGIDAGDHKSEDSTNMVSQSPDKCLLCRIKNHTTIEKEHIVYETRNFFVVPGTGAFFEGYLMIVPKRHTMSFALLPEKERNEFLNILYDVSSILEGIYGKKVFAFECGSGKTGAGKHETSIVHAHFHLAPTNMPVLQEVQKSGLHPALINKEDLGEYGENPYMLYVDQDDNWYIASDPHDYYPRQHPRQVLANWMDCYDIYNWRIHPFREKMDVIANEFRNYCRKNFNSLPKWVQSSIRFED